MKRFRVLAAALLLLLAAGWGVYDLLQSPWLSQQIRARIVTAAEQATGGRVELGAFKFDWRTLSVEVENLVIHGLEGPAEAPLLSIDRVVLGLGLRSLAVRELNITSLALTRPQAHLIFSPDGTTNIPEPHGNAAPGSAVESILNLRIGRFRFANGAIRVEAPSQNPRIIPWAARGDNLRADASFDASGKRYQGTLSASRVRLDWNGFEPLAIDIATDASLERNRFSISSATLKTAGSSLLITHLVVENLTAPTATATWKAQLSLSEADAVLKLVNFRHTGTLDASGNLRYASSRDYRIEASVLGNGINYGKIGNLAVAAKLVLDPTKIAIDNLRARALGGELAASGTITGFENFHLFGTLVHFDARTAAALFTSVSLPYEGLVSGPFDALGKLREQNFHQLKLGAALTVSPAPASLPVKGEVAVQYDGSTSTLELAHSWLELPSTRIELSGIPDRKLIVQFQTHDLADLAPALAAALAPSRSAARLPFSIPGGSLAFSGSVSGPTANPEIAGHATLHNVVYQNQKLDSAEGDFTVSSHNLTVDNASVIVDSQTAKITGSLGLGNWSPSDASPLRASIQLRGALLPKLLALAGHPEIPATGTLTTSAEVNGTLGAPRANADFTLSKGQLYGEPYDTVTGRAQYSANGVQTLTATATAPRKRLTLSARLETPTRLSFDIATNPIQLSEVAAVRTRQPDLRGLTTLKATGSLELLPHGFRLLALNSELNATSLFLGSRALGDAHLTAQTSGNVVNARLDSNAAGAKIHGEGSIQLDAAYTTQARFTFSSLGLAGLAAAFKLPEEALNFDGSAAGDLTLAGPAARPDDLRAELNVTQFEMRPLHYADLVLRNTGPVRISLAHSVAQVESAHFVAPQTDLSATGSIALNERQPLNLNLNGKLNLAFAQSFSPDLTATGDLSLNATLRGTFSRPDLAGRAELQKADFHFASFTNGLSNTNAVILFNGARATIQTFSGESGGGKVDIAGFAALSSGVLAFRFESRAHEVRVRYPEGVSSVSDATLTLAGTSQRSEVSGLVTLRRIALNPRLDIATILSHAADPIRTPETSSSLLSNVNLDIQVETAPDLALETSITQSIQADASLRLRGTAASPALLGRINITQGDLVFLGNKYTINQGSVSFFNAAKIEPVLNIDLSTKARGVDVTLTVSGPVTRLNVSYRSDPPLQFSDIVALLATGRTPTDPALAVRDTGQSLSLQQLGASALLGQAIANPVAGRLQRFFGVSRLKIDPQLTGITATPQARLTIEQQITPDILFTYVSDVSNTSTQLIRVEWDFNRRWSAILVRQENGYIGLDFAWRKRFK